MAFTATVALATLINLPVFLIPQFFLYRRENKEAHILQFLLPHLHCTDIHISPSEPQRERERESRLRDCSSSIILFPKLPKLPASWNRFEQLSAEMKRVCLGSLWDNGWEIQKWHRNSHSLCLLSPSHTDTQTRTHIVTLGKTKMRRRRASDLLCEIIMDCHLKQNKGFCFNCS